MGYYVFWILRYLLVIAGSAGAVGLLGFAAYEVLFGKLPADGAIVLLTAIATLAAIANLARDLKSNRRSVGLLAASLPFSFTFILVSGDFLRGRKPPFDIIMRDVVPIATAFVAAGCLIWLAAKNLPSTRADDRVDRQSSILLRVSDWLRRNSADAGLRKYAAIAGYMIVGALAFQGLLSMVRSPAPPPPAPPPQQVIVQAPPAKPVDTGIRFTTIAVAEKNFWVRTAKTRDESLQKAKTDCSYCRYIGPDFGRCAGYIEFWIASPIFVVGEDAASAEAKAYSVCITRYDREHCRYPKSLCGSTD